QPACPTTVPKTSPNDPGGFLNLPWQGSRSGNSPPCNIANQNMRLHPVMVHQAGDLLHPPTIAKTEQKSRLRHVLRESAGVQYNLRTTSASVSYSIILCYENTAEVRRLRARCP